MERNHQYRPLTVMSTGRITHIARSTRVSSMWTRLRTPPRKDNTDRYLTLHPKYSDPAADIELATWESIILLFLQQYLDSIEVREVRLSLARFRGRDLYH